MAFSLKVLLFWVKSEKLPPTSSYHLGRRDYSGEALLELDPDILVLDEDTLKMQNPSEW